MARTIDIAVAQNDVVQPVEELKCEEVVLDRVFADPVGSNGIDGVVLRNGHVLGLSVAGARGGDVDEPFSSMGERGFNQIDGAENIDLSVE